MLTLVRVPDACSAFKRCRSQHPHNFSFVSMVGLNFKRIACPVCINFWTVSEEENIIALLLGSGGRRGE